MKTGLVISTYNWPEALDLVLKSFNEQSLKPDEIIVADDGSTVETATLIENYRNQGLPVKHIWQEDQGFRKAAILNKAISSSTADYIIQVDGDCILHKKFIQDHVENVEKGKFLYGSRVNIKKERVEEVLNKSRTEFSFFSRDINKRSRSIHAPALRKYYKDVSTLSGKVRGCNLSYWKSDFLAINGYNEDFKGWGKEDSEMVARLINNGLVGKRLRFNGIVYHIWHPNKSRDNVETNSLIQDTVIEKKMTYCENGVQKYIK
jgi:glycosyltransferase involved in cell wall biosynthesis